MNTTTAALAEFSAAAHMPGMNTASFAELTADLYRAQTVEPNYDATHERINEVARAIAAQALAVTGGRATYSWTGNGIRLVYTGDTVDDQGDFAYGPTIREYLVGDEYKTTSPIPSQSGTGLLNLSLDHVKDCSDPVVEAKRQIAWLLLDPSLDLVEYTIRTTTAWQGLLQTPHKIRTALAIRLAEVVEQKVLENPGGGLDLKDIVEGTNVVGYMVKTLDGSIFNLMKRIITNESKHRTTLDTPTDDDDAYRRPVAELATEQLPQSAELDAITNGDDLRAIETMEAMQDEQTAIAAARANKTTVRSRRASEKSAIVARTFLSQTGLPSIELPSVEMRLQLLEELDKDETLAFGSFIAWHNLMYGESTEADYEVTDAWISLWKSYTADDTEAMIGLVGNHPDRVAKIVEGLLAVPDKMNAAAKLRILNTVRRLADDTELNNLVAAAADKYDAHRRGGNAADWQMAARAVIKHKACPVESIADLTAVFDDALYSLGLD